MKCKLGHKTYHDNLDGVLQSLMVINLAWVLQRCCTRSSMVLAKCFATYGEVLLLYWFYLDDTEVRLRCCLSYSAIAENKRGMVYPFFLSATNN